MTVRVKALLCGAVACFVLGGESAVELNWIGKEKVVNHHNDVPYHVLEKQWTHGEDTNTENMVIHGDNLLALKSLLPRYEGRIKCIYIDPPYNTGNEGWCYNDNVNDPRIKKWLGEVVGKEGEDFTRHDKWLCMMYPRLRLISKLLSQDGCLAISIGWHEVQNLSILCNEIFASRQTVVVTVQTSGGKPSGGFNFVHEYLVFVVPKDFSPNASVAAQNEYASPYHGMNLATFDQVQRPNQAYPIFVNGNCEVVGIGKSLQDRVKDGSYTGELKDFVFDYDEAPIGASAVWPVSKKGVPCVWRLVGTRVKADYDKGYIKVVPQNPGKTKNKYSIQYLSEGIIEKIENGELETYRSNPMLPTLEIKNFKTGGVSVGTLWTDKRFYTAQGGSQIRSIFGSKAAFSYPKPLDLVKEVFLRTSSKNDIILDSFAGSGTTAHAALNLNHEDGGTRTFILVEMGDYAESVTAERVKRVIDGYGEGKNAIEGTGGSFGYYELGPELMKDGVLNEEVGSDKIREYVFYTETKQPVQPSKEVYKLGEVYGVAYYFCYEKDRIVTLDRALLRSIKTKAESYVIFADTCTLSAAELERFHITFKKIPRDITRF